MWFPLRTARRKDLKQQIKTRVMGGMRRREGI